MRDEDWDRLVDQLAEGDCTPFLGAGACHGTLPTGVELSEDWASRTGYPFADTTALASVMDYAIARYLDPVYVKGKVARELEERGYPNFDDPAEPHALLAGFPLAVYLTTNYDDFMVAALDRRGRAPRRVTCPWFEGAPPCPDGIGLSADEPVVFHLHGNAENPPTMVLAEKDYIEFLTNLMLDYGADERRLIPAGIRAALTNRSLLFLGYGLRDWTFITLFDGLLKTIPGVHRRRHVSVQLPPSSAASAEAAKAYLTRYFDDWNISVYWGEITDFCRELRERSR